MARREVLLAAVAFGAGVAVGALALPRSHDSSVRPFPGTSAEGSEPGAREDPLDATAPGTGGGGGPAAAPRSSSPPTLARPSLPARMADFDTRLRQRVAEAGREALGEPLPQDMLDEAVRLTEAELESQPASFAKRMADRERMRRKIGELTDPFEIVIQGRTGSWFEADVGFFLQEKQPVVPSPGPIDVSTPVKYSEPSLLSWKGGVVPPGRVAVFESIEIRGVLGFAGSTNADGEISVQRLDGIRVDSVRGPGAKEVRYLGTHLAPTWGGDRRGDVSIRFYRAAGQVRIRGRLLAGDVPAPREVRFHWAPEGSDGYLRTGLVRLQVAADHGGGNPRTLSILGSHSQYLESLSTQPVWDEARDPGIASFGYASGVGIVPPGKVFRVTRVDWRARFYEAIRGGGFDVRVAGQTIVSLRGETLVLPSAPRTREALSPSGIWKGDLLVREGEEEKTDLTCTYYVMGEAVIEGEIVDAR